LLSLMKYRTEPLEDPCGECTVADFAADGRFAPIRMLASVGAVLCFAADVVAGSGDWDDVAVVGYPSRRSFIDLATRNDFQAWHAHKQSWLDRTTVMSLLPATDLPGLASTGRILLETWDGPVPPAIAYGEVAEFDVEGTIVGDGRMWSGSRFTSIAPGTPLPLQEPRPEYEAMLLQPTVERWRWPI
jgi:hypothetical protein